MVAWPSHLWHSVYSNELEELEESLLMLPLSELDFPGVDDLFFAFLFLKLITLRLYLMLIF